MIYLLCFFSPFIYNSIVRQLHNHRPAYHIIGGIGFITIQFGNGSGISGDTGSNSSNENGNGNGNENY